jgi:hypothetical protein
MRQLHLAVEVIHMDETNKMWGIIAGIVVLILIIVGVAWLIG